MFSLLTTLTGWNLKRRIRQIEHFMLHPHEVQHETLLENVKAAALTEWGRKYHFSEITTVKEFQESVPISTYETLFPYIKRMLEGEADILWHGQTDWFAKSSGTTNDKSKYIPISDNSLYDCHFKAGKDLIALYLHSHRKDSRLFSGKILSVGGSHEQSESNPQVKLGDLSAVLLENLPIFYEFIRTPSKPIALMAKWEDKLEAMSEEVMDEDVTAIVGVPSWTLLLLQRVLKKKQAKSISEVWPNLEAFFYGGVHFLPYKPSFDALLNHKVAFINTYNASEGFLGIQLSAETDDLLLMLDYGIFYEFIPMEQLAHEKPQALTLAEVKMGVNYALIISTNAGLWRYMIGDTVTFTSLSPYQVKITGRTQHFINCFGEELMVRNADEAIFAASVATHSSVKEYTAAPVFPDNEKMGGHEWLIEFETPPQDLDMFGQILDQTLCKVNSDYDAKRAGNILMSPPIIHPVPTGTFYDWMKKRGKLGGQNKVPKLYASRVYLDNILGCIR